MKKEKELAEKRKNDPPLELSNDHPVRKLISRFRKMGDVKSNTNDLEKGGPKVLSHDRPASGATKVINVSEHPTAVNSLSKLGGGASKWGRLISGAAAAEGKRENAIAYRLPETSAQEEAGKKASDKQERNNEATSRSIIRNVAKLNKVLENHPPSIDEAPEHDQKSNLKKTESQDSGILKSNKTLDQISNSSDGSQCSRHQSNGALSVVEQQMLTSLYDIRLEFKEEMEIMHQKMNRIDEQISEILRMFSPTISQCSSHVTSCACSHGCSKYPSPHNTNTNSVEHSPKTSVTSSPRRMSRVVSSASEKQSELANMCDEVINMDISHQTHETPRESSLSHGKDKTKTPKSSITKSSHQQDPSDSPNVTKSRKTNRVSPETNYSEKSSSRKSTPSPAPGEGPLTTRDIDIPLKDRDLDIL